MKRVFLFLLLLAFGASAMAQQQIQLRSADKAECTKSDMTSLKASFSFSTIEAQDYESEQGTFSWLSLANTVLGGNVGDPQVPVINQLIAVPFGANPRIEITSYSTTDYRLEDYDMKTLVPRQPSVRKDQKPEDVPFVMNEAVYQTRGLHAEPTATVSVEGMMRGVQLGTMTIEPVSYDPVNNTIRVFNDIEVTVHFDGADTQATEDMLLRTYSPAFEPVYAQLFNNRAITDVYTDHPDLYNTPVKMLVICYSGFQGNAALNSWLQWKLQKGYYVDIYYTNETGTSATNIKNFIKTKYNASVSAGNAYTYLIVIGDTGQVPQYMTKTVDESCASDLGYAAVNFTTSSTSNYFPDMYYSRMSVENTTHLTNYINKVLTYEKFELSDGGNYLNNVILVGGWDSNWTPKVAKPTINYATNYYFKSSNTTYGGFGNGTIKATISTSSTQGYSGTNNGCYQGINNGVCFLNYTAHGDKQEWYQPKMTAAQVATLTNTGKYFFGVGNCCLTGNFNNTSTDYSPGSSIGTNACFAETMIRVPNAGAVAYVGCSPYSYWYEDFYWAVGAHSYSAGNYPTQSASSKGVYDIMFEDQYWNSASALLYLGNLAVQQAVTNGNQTSSITAGNCNNSAHYYFQFYHTFGDGSVMPYITKPEVNSVTIPSTVTPGTTSIIVNALAGSYVAVTDNSSVIYGVAEANESGVATVNFTNAIPSNGTLYVVVTRQQYQPYFGTISIVGGTQYTITANINPENSGTVEGDGQYYGNTQCTLTATANNHYEFSRWTKNGTQVSTENPYTFTVTGNATYVANFTAMTPHTVSCNTVENGTISANPTTAYKNETVTLSATPASGYFFSAWDVRDANNNSIAVTNDQFIMPDSDVTVSATFVQGYNVTLAEATNGSISASTTNCVSGTTVTLTATPATGYVLNSWVVFKTGDVNTTVAVNGNSFTMPDYDVTVVGVFSAPQGGDVTIGSGNSTNSNLPTNISNSTFSPKYYSISQQIYTAADLGDAGTITKVAFKVSNSNTATRNIDVYLSHTAKSAFSSKSDWVQQNIVNRVYSGSVTFASSGWTTITLDTPFEYNGTSNLLLTVDDNTGSSASATLSFYVYTATNRALCNSGKNTNYDPASVSGNGNRMNSVNQVVFTKAISGTIESLSVTPNTLDEFTYAQGEGPSAAKAVTLVACAAEDITVTAPEHFEVSDEANGSYGSTLTIPVSDRGNREEITYGFEDGTTQGWTVSSSDNGSTTWAVGQSGYNPSGASGTVYTSNSGSYYVGSVYDASNAVDDWLISPQITLGGSMSFYIKITNTSYTDYYSVHLSTGSTAINQFTTTLLSSTQVTSTNYTLVSVDLSAYSGQGYVAIRHTAIADQASLLVDDITIVEGGDPVTPINPTNAELVTANVYVRLKAGLSQGEYESETLSVSAGSLSSNVILNGEVTQGSAISQTVSLVQGWNWFVSTVDISLQQLEQALGSSGIIIMSQESGYATYEDEEWSGTLQSLVPGQVYNIQVSSDCNFTLSGSALSSVTITIVEGYNWIGYTGSDAISIEEALNGFTPSEEDSIISFDEGFTNFEDGEWSGTLNQLEPGHGYIYISRDPNPKQIIF